MPYRAHQGMLREKLKQPQPVVPDRHIVRRDPHAPSLSSVRLTSVLITRHTKTTMAKGLRLVFAEIRGQWQRTA
jgi:hypothetical protein